MLNHKLVRTVTLVALLSCSSIALADTCPAPGQLPSNWALGTGSVSNVSFHGAVYGMFGPMTVSCKYYESNPATGYVLISKFNVQKPTRDARWQVIAGYLTCVSTNIAICQFYPQP